MSARLHNFLSKKRINTNEEIVSANEEKNGSLEILKNIGIFFGAVIPISIASGCLIIASYLSHYRASAYITDVISNPNILIYLSLHVGFIILLSSIIFSCNFIFMSEFKIENTSLYNHLKDLHREGRKKDVALLIFIYSSLLAIAIAVISIYYQEDADTKFMVLYLIIATLLVSVISSLLSLWIIEKKHYPKFIDYLTSRLSINAVTFKELEKNISFFPLMGINIFSITILINYIPRMEKLEVATGKYHSLIMLTFLAIIIFLINYLHIITNKKYIYYVTPTILLILMSIKIHHDDNKNITRNILKLNDNRIIILSKKTVDELSLNSISKKHKNSLLCEIKYENVIIPTNDSLIIKTDHTIVSLPKLQVIGEVSYMKKYALHTKEGAHRAPSSSFNKSRCISGANDLTN